MAVAAQYADAWIVHGDAADEARPLEALCRQFDDACQRVGRDPATVARIYLAADEERPFASTDAFSTVAARAGAAGFTDLAVHHPRPEDPAWNDPVWTVEAVAAKVLPTLSQGIAL
jgi:alkanesulfonate monooxygenase SsuD/methylene tetrahydromethanopterin reductase-like flavin-dependent oxidoreductase (luciferase family)